MRIYCMTPICGINTRSGLPFLSPSTVAFSCRLAYYRVNGNYCSRNIDPPLGRPTYLDNISTTEYFEQLTPSSPNARRLAR